MGLIPVLEKPTKTGNSTALILIRVAGSKPAWLINELKKHVELFLCALTINLLLSSLLLCNVIKISKRNSSCQSLNEISSHLKQHIVMSIHLINAVQIPWYEGK
jgi:hypothetical protein